VFVLKGRKRSEAERERRAKMIVEKTKKMGKVYHHLIAPCKSSFEWWNYG